MPRKLNPFVKEHRRKVRLTKRNRRTNNSLIRDAMKATAKLLGWRIKEISYTTDSGTSSLTKGTPSYVHFGRHLTGVQMQKLQKDGWEKGSNGGSRHPGAACYFKKIPGVKTIWGDSLQLFI